MKTKKVIIIYSGARVWGNCDIDGTIVRNGDEGE